MSTEILGLNVARVWKKGLEVDRIGRKAAPHALVSRRGCGGLRSRRLADSCEGAGKVDWRSGLRTREYCTREISVCSRPGTRDLDNAHRKRDSVVHGS